MQTGKESTQSQCTRILKYLRKGGALTPLDALRKFGSFRLGARVYDLRKSGHAISRRMVEKGGKRVAEYRLGA